MNHDPGPAGETYFKRILEELSDLHRRGNTIIMVTHNPRLTTYASRVITMNDGKIDTDTQEKPKKSKTGAKRPLGNKRTKQRGKAKS